MNITFQKSLITGIGIITAIALLASCAQDQTVNQIDALNNKVAQLQKGLDEAKSAQPTLAAKIVELNTKIAQLDKDLAEARKPKPEPERYVIGLGEIMGLTQMRHAKLWFAGANANWDLADYEFAELKEGFADVMTFHPTHDGVPQPLTTLIPAFTDEPLATLEKAIAAKDKKQFATAFDGLTHACNGCHTAANFSFNVITRPISVTYTNQVFTPKP
jgi:outer membrane murein-binding lipoprotein Lpp